MAESRLHSQRLKPCALCTLTCAGIKRGHVVLHALCLLSVTQHCESQTTLHAQATKFIHQLHPPVHEGTQEQKTQVHTAAEKLMSTT